MSSIGTHRFMYCDIRHLCLLLNQSNFCMYSTSAWSLYTEGMVLSHLHRYTYCFKTIVRKLMTWFAGKPQKLNMKLYASSKCTLSILQAWHRSSIQLIRGRTLTHSKNKCTESSLTSHPKLHNGESHNCQS